MPTPFGRVLAALQQDGWRVDVESSVRSQPVELTAARGTVVQRLRVYIWKVTRGGPDAVRPSEEYRIQKMTRAPLQLGDGRLTLLLGWYEPDDVFVAWDAAAHVAARYSASIQVRAPYIDEARLFGMAIQHREQPAEDVVVVRAGLFSAYLEQAATIHGRQLGNEDLTFPELDTERIKEAENAPREEQRPQRPDRVPPAGAPQERRRIENRLTRWWRSTTFPQAVTWAYDYRCAVCGIGLNLVQAAHIVPVTDPHSSEHPSNGLGLCPLHHAAYDARIFGVTSQFAVIYNPATIAALEQRGRAAGLELFRRITPEGQQINLPGYAPYQPDPALLERAVVLRGFP